MRPWSGGGTGQRRRSRCGVGLGGGQDKAGGLGSGGDRARRLPDAGEPVVRPLLRDVSGRARVRRPPGGEASARSASAGRAGATAICCRSISTRSRGSASARMTCRTTGCRSTCAGGRATTARSCATHTMAQYEGPEQGTVTMGYHTRSDIPFYYALADAFTICDNYHCSVFGPDAPEPVDERCRARCDPAGSAGGPVLETNDSSDAVYSVSWDTMPEVLEDAGRELEGVQPGGDAVHAGVHRATRPVDQRCDPPLLQAVLQPELGAVPEGVPAALPQRLRGRRARRGRCPRSAG